MGHGLVFIGWYWYCTDWVLDLVGMNLCLVLDAICDDIALLMVSFIVDIGWYGFWSWLIWVFLDLLESCGCGIGTRWFRLWPLILVSMD